MNRECDFIQDLLPIYAEQIASKSTEQLVEEHLHSCSACRNKLDEMKIELMLPIDTETKPLADLGIGFRRQSLLTAACCILALLILLHCVLILFTVPVWLSQDEAIMEIVGTQTVGTMNPPREELVFITAPNVLRMHQNGSAIWCEGCRFSNQTTEPIRSSIFLRTDIKESFFYRGYFADEGNSLLYGSADAELASMPREPGADVDQTLRYIFFAALVGGSLCLVVGLAFCKQLGKGVAWIGVLLLCAALAVYFVTGGHFALQQDSFEPHVLYSELVFRLGHIAVLTLLLWGFGICLWKKAGSWRKGRRGDSYAACL